jgi:hypothetical protein
MTDSDLDQLSKHVADKANKTKDKKLRQKLDVIFEEIRTLEQSYYGAHLRIIVSSPSAKSTEFEIK